jgi:Zn-dependent protease
MSFVGFIFAAPGAVYTYGNRNQRQQMLISVAGPITNIVLALIFYVVPGQVGSYGFQINAWLALFNMIPAGGLDGESVYRYNKMVFGAVVAAAGLLVFVL